ncbi:MAG: altronate dehydratase [Phycisphaeraceae bacterium]|nr:altronate dehydratase [Phycisphaeraceae bacterium]
MHFDQCLLRLHADDHVAVARRPIQPGTELSDGRWRIVTNDAIPGGHKLAIREVAEGEPVLKYGQVIGFASQHIVPGDHVHSHNLEVRDFGRDHQIAAASIPLEPYPPGEVPTFEGYLRPDGRVGTRNYVAVVSSVNCSASTSRYIIERFVSRGLLDEYQHVDGIIAVTHKTGCCVQPGEPASQLERVLAGFARHPNVAAYIMIGLGCETNQMPVLIENQKLDIIREGEQAPTFMTIQERGGISKTIEAGVEAVARLLPVADAMRRTRQPAGKLVLAEQCGGSDAHSGITANPALGYAADELVRCGGSAVLAETPEIYGAEHLLTRRAISRAVGEALLERIGWWEDHVRMHGASIDNNPTFGNKQGGLTTIYEKSLGAVAKAGQAPLAAVYRYAQRIDVPGMGFMDSPGYDPVSMTGLVAGGATVGVFTTGRGSVYGCKPMPCLKIATTTDLYERMTDDMDINAGTILDGTETVDQVGQRIFEAILEVAGGRKTKSELAGVGDEEFAPWMLGPTL